MSQKEYFRLREELDLDSRYHAARTGKYRLLELHHRTVSLSRHSACCPCTELSADALSRSPPPRQ